MTDKDYPFYPGGRPVWPFANYARETAPATPVVRKRGPKLDLTPRRSVARKAPHGGVYSKAGT